MAEQEGYRVGTLDAQECKTFEDLRTMAEWHRNYLDPEYQKHDRARLAKEFTVRNGIASPAPFDEHFRIGYSRAVVDVLRMIERP